MALTRITKGVIKPNENYDTHNINSTGIVTATGLDISGNASIGGVLTYEDVTSIDSVGIITARDGIHVTGGSVGIGTNNPSRNLTIHGGSGDAKLNFSNVGTGATGTVFGANSNGNTILWIYENKPFYIATNNQERLRITSTGRVGIGTDNPASIFHLNSSSSAEVKLTLQNTGGTTAIYGNNDDIIMDADKYRIRNNNGSTEYIRITNAGNIGIGSEDPTEKLDVAGHIKLDSGPVLKNSSSGDILRITSPTGYVEVGPRNSSYAHFMTDRTRFYFNRRVIVDEGIVSSYGSNDLLLTTGSSPTTSDTGIFIKNSTNEVGIGTNNPVRPLHIEHTDCRIRLTDVGHATDVELQNTSGDAILTTNGASNVRLQTNNAERLRIRSDGAIGINTTGNFSNIALSIFGADVGEGTAKGQLILKDTAAYNASPTAGIIFQGIHAAGSQAIFAGIRGFKENATNGNYAGALAFDVRAQGAVAYEALRIDSDGDVLINTTTSPTADIKLLVNGNGGVSSGSYFSFRGDYGNVPEPAAYAIKFDSSIFTSGGLHQYAYGGIAFNLGGQPRINFTSTGRIGIGTDGPVTALDVAGDIYFSNGALISNFDSNGTGGSNIDHIWHSDASNYGRGGTWNFVSDGAFKSAGQSTIQIGYLANSGGGHLIGDVGIGLTTISRGPLHVHENSSDDCEIHLTNNDTGTTSSDGLTIFTDTDTSGVWSRENVPFDIASAGTRSLRLHNTGGLSINTTSKSTSSMLQVDNHGDRDTGTNMNESQYVVMVDPHFTGSQNVTSNRSKAGIRNDVEYSCTGTSSATSGSRMAIYGIYNDINATKYAYVNDGIYSFVKSTADNQVSGQSTTIRGIYGYGQGYLTNTQANVNIYGGYFLGYRGGDVTTGHCYGIYTRAHNTNGTNNSGDLTAVYAEWEQDEGTTINNAYCFRGYGDRDAGTITNGYILYGSHGGDGDIQNRWGIYISDSAKNYLAGNLEISGTFEKGNDNFRIPHPLVGLSTTKDLVHSVIEGPQMDLIYRGKVDLVDGTATINIDTKAGMTEGTFVALCRDIQCFTSNETGWTNVKGSVTGNQLTIIAQDNICTDTISWMVVGERQDDTAKSATCTDDDGNLIIEPDTNNHLNDYEQPECEKNIYNET